MTTPGLRSRVAAAIAITCIAVVSALSLGLYTASHDLEETLLDEIVGEEMTSLVRYHRDHPASVREAGPNLQYYIAKIPDELSRIPADLRDLPVGRHEIGEGRGEKHVAVREIDGMRYIVAYDAGQHEVRERQFVRLMLFALFTVIAASAVVGYWIAGLVTRQITDLAGRVARLEPGAPRAALAVAGQDPEVSALARAFDQYQARIGELLAHEQEFTGNASHELRTPLTAICTSCELLETEPGLPEKARTRVAAIASAAQRMAGQLDMLLFLARAQAVDTRETVSLAACINAALEPWRPALERKGLRFDNAIDPAISVSANRQALALVATNLLRNAVQYTDHGQIRATWSAPTLSISDTGPGVAPGQQARLFERHYRGTSGADGFGLGLAIVKRACDHCGWRIGVASSAGSGTTFTVTLA